MTAATVDELLGRIVSTTYSADVQRWLIDHEAHATRIWCLEDLVPGLLQTEQYTRTILGVYSEMSPDEVDARVELRLRRQQHVLHRPDPPRCRFVLRQQGIDYLRHGPDFPLARAVLMHLLEVSQLPHVSIRLLPFAAGPRFGAHAPYYLVEAGDGLVHLLVENSLGTQDQAEPSPLVARHLGHFDTVSDLAWSESQTRQRLRRYLGAIPA